MNPPPADLPLPSIQTTSEQTSSRIKRTEKLSVPEQIVPVSTPADHTTDEVQRPAIPAAAAAAHTVLSRTSVPETPLTLSLLTLSPRTFQATRASVHAVRPVTHTTDLLRAPVWRREPQSCSSRLLRSPS